MKTFESIKLIYIFVFFFKINIMKKIYYVIFGLFVLSSCKNSQVLLFQNIPENIVETSIPEPIIKNGDILDISITSLNNQSTNIFSPTNPNQFGTLRNLESRKLEGYLVDNSGNIEIPIIGKLKAKGLTCSFLSQSIKIKLEEFIKTPFVRSKIINFSNKNDNHKDLHHVHTNHMHTHDTDIQYEYHKHADHTHPDHIHLLDCLPTISDSNTITVSLNSDLELNLKKIFKLLQYINI